MPPKKTYPALLLTQSGDVTPTAIAATGPLTLKAIQAHFKPRKGIDCIGTYRAKPHMLHLFGVTEGPEETQNQHQLPPPFDAATFYGDLLLVACKVEDKTYEAPVQFKPEDYEEFYTKMFDGGYDSDGVEEEEADAEVEADLEGVEEEDADARKDFAEEEEEEDEEDDADVEDADADEEDAPRPKAKAPKKKKVVAKTAALAGVGFAYPDPPILAEEEQLQEEVVGPTNRRGDQLQEELVGLARSRNDQLQEEVAAPSPEAPAPRRRVLDRLTTLFAEHLDAPAITDLERCIYNGAIRQARARHVVRSWSYPLFVRVYTMHALHIVSNFHPASYVGNAELFDQVKRGDLSLDAMATMNTYELYPSLWREMFEQRAVREKKQLEGNRDRATDQFLCTRCWKRECTYYEMQTRSADEPMTIFITCLNCGKKWRQ